MDWFFSISAGLKKINLGLKKINIIDFLDLFFSIWFLPIRKDQVLEFWILRKLNGMSVAISSIQKSSLTTVARVACKKAIKPTVVLPRESLANTTVFLHSGLQETIKPSMVLAKFLLWDKKALWSEIKPPCPGFDNG